MANKPNNYDLGDKVKVSATFTDPDDSEAAYDPSVVKVSHKDPSGNVTTWTYGTDSEVVKDSTGNYHALIDADEAGTWYYRWFSTGTGQAAEEQQFRVKAAQATE